VRAKFSIFGDSKELMSIHAVENGAAATNDDEDPEQPIFSTITGEYRQAKRYGSPSIAINYGEHSAECVVADNSTRFKEDSGLSAMILRNQDNTVSKLSDSAAGKAGGANLFLTLMNLRPQASSCRSVHIKGWKPGSGKMHPAS
jgi:hypothetical protein